MDLSSEVIAVSGGMQSKNEPHLMDVIVPVKRSLDHIARDLAAIASTNPTLISVQRPCLDVHGALSLELEIRLARRILSKSWPLETNR